MDDARGSQPPSGLSEPEINHRSFLRGEDLAYARILTDEVQGVWRKFDPLALEFAIETEPDVKLDRFQGCLRDQYILLAHIVDSLLVQWAGNHGAVHIKNAAACLRRAKDVVVTHREALAQCHASTGTTNAQAPLALDLFRKAAEGLREVAAELREAADGCCSYIGFKVQDQHGEHWGTDNGGEHAAC